MARDLMKMKIVELQKLAQEHVDDLIVKKKIIDELGYRTTLAARRLLAELTGVGAPPKAKSRVGKKQATDGKRASKKSQIDTGPVVHSAPTIIEPPLERGLQQTFELLRATFTIEAEILARWGMTPTLPESVRVLIFAEWSKKLKAGRDDFGRSSEMLDKDMKSLQEAQGLEI